MTLRTRSLRLVLTIMIIAVAGAGVLSGCGDGRDQESSTTASSDPIPAAADPATADEGSTSGSPTPAPSEGSSQPSEAAEDPELAARKAAVEQALAESKITSDPKGQWATSAEASSAYGDGKDLASYSAWQATGAPNVESYGDNGAAWTSNLADAGIEWLQVGFEKPVHATGIRIRQSYAPGAIVRIDLLDESGALHPVFEGVDETPSSGNGIVWFERTFEKTAFLANGAKITLATNAVPEWNEIDAVQLLGE